MRPTPTFSWSKLNQGGQLFVAALLLLSSSGCRCPWTSTNAQLNDSSRWLRGGIEAFHNGDHDEAEQLLGRAIETRPGDPILKEHLASIYLERGKPSKAISQLMDAAEISGENALLHVQIGKIYLANGQWILARQYARKALETDRRLAEAWSLKADVELAKGALNQALNDYQRALSLNPNLPSVQLKVAEVHRLSGRPLRAYSTIEQMLSQIPPHDQPEEALLLAGRLLIELKQPAQAIAKLSRAAQHPDASPNSFMQLSKAQRVMGRESEAQSTLLLAQQKFPQNQAITQQISKLRNSNERLAAIEPVTDQFTR